MAGQPLSRLRRIERIEAELVGLLKRLDREIPDWARKQPTPKYPGAAVWVNLLDAGFFLGFRLLQVGDLLASSALPPGERHEPELVEFLANWSTGRTMRDTRFRFGRGEADDDGDSETEELDRDPADVCATEPMAVPVRDSDAVPVLRADDDALAGSGAANGITLEASAMDGVDTGGNARERWPMGA
jgi:hypothetical protein